MVYAMIAKNFVLLTKILLTWIIQFSRRRKGNKTKYKRKNTKYFKLPYIAGFHRLYYFILYYLFFISSCVFAPLKSWMISSRHVDSMETFTSGCERFLQMDQTDEYLCLQHCCVMHVYG